MEDADGFIRTIPDDPAADVTAAQADNENGSDSDASDLDFTMDDGISNNTSQFFAETRATAPPSAWSFEKARESAKAPQPYQTTIDAKIRSAREQIQVAVPTSDNEDEDEDSDVEKEEKDGGKGENAGLDGDDREDDADNNAKQKSIDNSETPKAKKKKRVSLKDDVDLEKDGERTSSKDARLELKAKTTSPKGKKIKPKQDDTVPDKEKSKSKKQKAKKKSTDSNLPQTFLELHLSRPLQKAVEMLEWTTPTPIQARVIPYILAGRDVCASAVTGSGKTGAFVLPVLERLIQAGIDNVSRVVMLLPTRELAAQCHAVVTSLARYTGVRAALAVGGLNAEAQQVALRTRPHIVVATPGRLIDHVRNSHGFSLDDIEVLVMDEADRLLDMGFQAEVEEIVRYINDNAVASRQTLLFSATITSKLQALIKLSLKDPIHIAVDQVLNVADALQQEFIKIRPSASSSQDHNTLKQAILLALASRTFTTRTIIFFKQKVTAHRMKILFGLASLSCAELHGNLTQAQRLAALDSFREGHVNFLLCTDLAARGLDIIGIDTVINYDLSGELREYVHRVGRTARAGRAGRACSFVCSDVSDERKLVRAIGKRMRSSSSSADASGGDGDGDGDGDDDKNNNEQKQGQRTDGLTARVVPPTVVARWSKWVERVEPAVRDVLKQERHERELRLAEMQVQKANNMLKFESDIYSRPPKTWFQTEQQKTDQKDQVREHLGLPKPVTQDRSKLAVRKRKAEQAEQRQEDEKKRRKANTIIARQEDFAKQRMDARKQKRSKTSKKGKR